MDIKVSVIIPCYNQAHFLADAITSALEQEYDDKEIIVVNDGSPDNTAEVAAAFADDIVYLEQSNRGLSAARNAGIRAAQGEYIAFLDSDDIYLPGTLATQAAFLDTRANVALVCGDALLVDKDNREIGLKSEQFGKPKTPQNFRWETAAYCATPSTVMLRRQAFDTIGLFDEDLTRASEDWLLWMQMSLYHDMVYLEQPLIRYRLHDSNLTLDRSQIHAANRYAITEITSAPYFRDYPHNFRARLLYHRFTCTWHTEPKMVSLRYLARAVATDPRQLPYGLRMIGKGIRNTLRRRYLPVKEEYGGDWSET